MALVSASEVGGLFVEEEVRDAAGHGGDQKQSVVKGEASNRVDDGVSEGGAECEADYVVRAHHPYPLSL